MLGQHLLRVEHGPGAPGAGVLPADLPGDGRCVVGQVGLRGAVGSVSEKKEGSIL